MTDVLRNIKSGVTTQKEGYVVFMTSPVRGAFQNKAPVVNGVGCIVPSGSYGTTDNGPLDTRFTRPTYSST